MELQYNIYFELTSAFFLLFLWIYTRLQYHVRTVQMQLFMRMLALICLADILDVATAITISYARIIPVWFNYALNTLYFTISIVVGYHYFKYALTYYERAGGRSRPNFLEKSVLYIYLGFLVLNLFTGCIYSFQDGQYVHGVVYMLNYGAPYYYFITSAYFMFRSFKIMNRRQQISIFAYTVISFSGAILQIFFFPDVLLNIFAISLGIVIILLSLETPEYHQLMATLDKLEIANQKAQEANEAKSRFLACMSHEIRTPINAVLGMDEMILRESKDAQILEYAEGIYSSGNTLLALINDILDFSKIESGKMKIVEADYDVKEVLQDCYHMILPRAEAKQLKMEIFCDSSIPRRLHGDEKRIHQILTNLLTNAVKYTKEGKIILRVKWDTVEESSMKLLLSVEDTGIGISEENQKKLFQSFQRIDEENNRSIEGTGLGLAITQELVQQMGGEIGVYSRLGKGSLFYVEIPQQIVSAEPIGVMEENIIETTQKQEYHEMFTAPKAKILIVDDVEINLKVMRGLLKKTKIQIDTATSGKESLERAMQQKYDLIFMDDMMPEMDGKTTLKKLKEMENCCNADTKVIILTANAVSGAKEMYLAAGFDDYLSKPVTGAVIEQMLMQYLPQELIEEQNH